MPHSPGFGIVQWRSCRIRHERHTYDARHLQDGIDICTLQQGMGRRDIGYIPGCMARKRAKAEQMELPPTLQQCPQCGSHELILHGAIRSAVEQPVRDGEPVGERVSREEYHIVWERLSCTRCGAEC
jgi:hypothetical protein